MVNTEPNPKTVAYLKVLGYDPYIARLTAQVWELSQRLDDLTTYVRDLVQTQPADDPLPVHQILAQAFGECDHGRLHLDPCPDCNRTNR